MKARHEWKHEIKEVGVRSLLSLTFISFIALIGMERTGIDGECAGKEMKIKEVEMKIKE